jgi:hypothetical protein
LLGLGIEHHLHRGRAAFPQGAQIGLIGGDRDQGRRALGPGIAVDFADRSCTALEMVDRSLQTFVEPRSRSLKVSAMV